MVYHVPAITPSLKKPKAMPKRTKAHPAQPPPNQRLTNQQVGCAIEQHEEEEVQGIREQFHDGCARREDGLWNDRREEE